jgi:hypothetical protein
MLARHRSVSRKHSSPMISKTGSKSEGLPEKARWWTGPERNNDARRQNSDVRTLYIEREWRESPCLVILIDGEVEPRHQNVLYFASGSPSRSTIAPYAATNSALSSAQRRASWISSRTPRSLARDTFIANSFSGSSTSGGRVTIVDLRGRTSGAFPMCIMARMREGAQVGAETEAYRMNREICSTLHNIISHF